MTVKVYLHALSLIFFQYNSQSNTLPISSSTKRDIEPEVESLTLNTPSNVKKIKTSIQNNEVIPLSFKFGFIGLGNIGFAIVARLLNYGHELVIWNRSTDKVNSII